jgi:putative transposase
VVPYWRFFYHLIWATRGRLPPIDERAETVVLRSFELTAADVDLNLHAVGFMPDHVHIALTIPPKVVVSEAIRRLKGASTHALNERLAHDADGRFARQPEYGALTFGENSLPRIIAYVENQRHHHAEDHLWPTLERIDNENQPASDGFRP